MHIKSLLLRGFKTFADETEIEFGPDSRIIAIVGPNGCGKSNVLDATRWVLGEDNPRQLRVNSLSDIIFAGTAKRKPLSLAEVTLLLDNSDGRLPLAFTEIAIKRRAFREGESEFFINKNSCRLKDIKDLLLDTGLGEGTYSIITQGQVDAILSSKGEERRAFFEEAAGINKYKTRKISAEKKLIAAEQNLLRINDLKVEVSEQLITLEEQAHRARQYQELQTRVRELEIGISKKLLGSLLEKKARLEEEVATAKKEVAEKRATEGTIESNLLRFKEELRQLESAEDELSRRLDAEKDRLRDLELNRRFLEEERRRSERLAAENLTKQAELKEKLTALEHQPKPVFTPIYPQFTKIIQLIYDQANQTVSLLSAIFSFFGDGTLPSLPGPVDREETKRLKQELLQEEARRLEKELETIRFSLAANQRELASFSDESAEVAKENLLTELQELRQKKEHLRQQLAEQESQIFSQEKEEREKSERTAALEIALARIEGELVGIHEKLSSEYNLAVSDLETLPESIGSITKAKSEVEEGKRRMRALEPVNLLAIEEYDRTRERLAFIEAQLADLTGARENLKNLINELDLKAVETFTATMEQLSVVFSELFAKLFNGGEAKIYLAPNQPVLEAEILIEVRPDGRRWLPISSLSGGERSMSAIAILFSLLKIRPAAFCFLDEVDAALDEANIGRFTELLKDFSSTSPVVVITHNKRTMAAADSIYGVTMEEPGVSRVISMKLSQVSV